MDIDKRIEKLERALQNCKPTKCEGCARVQRIDDNYFCSLIKEDYRAMINVELMLGLISFNCPLIDKDSEEYKTISEELEILKELKEARLYLKPIEDITRDAFNGP